MIQGLNQIDPQTYSTNTLSRPVPKQIVSKWAANLDVPFSGITTDGTLKKNLFSISDEGAPVEQMVSKNPSRVPNTIQLTTDRSSLIEPTVSGTFFRQVSWRNSPMRLNPITGKWKEDKR